MINRSASDNSTAIRVILADSRAVYRVGIAQVLACENDIRVVAEVDALANIHRAVERFFNLPQTPGLSRGPIVLIDGDMISGSVDAISTLIRVAPGLKVIAHLNEKIESNTVALYRQGVLGIILRSVAPELLVKCIRKIAAGETWIDNQSINWVLDAYRSQKSGPISSRLQPRLSPKEFAIVISITRGLRNREIASRLGTTEQVIKNHLGKLYDKLGVSDRIELAHYGLRHQSHKKLADGYLRVDTVSVAHIRSTHNGDSNA